MPLCPCLAIDVDGLGIFPVGLGNDAHGIAVAFQHAADDGMTERGMVNISVADDIDEVALFPSTVDHILFTKGKKRHKDTSVKSYFDHYNRFPQKMIEEKEKTGRCLSVIVKVQFVTRITYDIAVYRTICTSGGVMTPPTRL